MGENKLPTSGFKWLTEEDIKAKFYPVENILSLDDEAEIGYYFEVDIAEVSQHLHDYLADYPLAPTLESIQPEWLSSYQQELVGNARGIFGRKLVPNFQKKDRYVVHYRNLKYYIEMGYQVTKIHSVVQFSQSYWMSPYIHKNSSLRAKSTSTFESDFFKLCNNCVYGKTMESVRKRIDVKIAHDGSAKLNKLIARPNFKSRKVFDGGLAALHMGKTKVTLNKPIYVGAAILDLSKLHMFKFYYAMKKQYKCELLYTDTDSLLMQIYVNDLEKDFYAKNLDLFDTSNFPVDHPLYSTINKAVVGKFKSETGSKTVAEFVGLRSKMYSIKISDNTTVKKAKGIGKIITQKELHHEKYLECLKERKPFSNTMHAIRSDHHHLGLYQQRKQSLSPLDTKRYILDDGIRTLPFGHYNTTCNSSLTNDLLGAGGVK
jgi:hypothetical protein